MKFGHDFLFISKYYRNAMLGLVKGDVVGMFLNTPTSQKKELERLARSGKASVIVVHLAPFDYSHKYPIAKLTPQVVQDAKFCNSIAAKYSAQIWISPFCEHTHSAKDMQSLFRKLKEVAPNCLLVNSIYKGGQEVDGTITEIHIEKSSALPRVPKNQFIVSFDGCGSTGTGDMPDLDIDAIVSKYSAALHIRAWNFRYNGKFGHKDPASLNARKHWPSVRYIRAHRAIIEPREGALTWKQGLMKPLADDHGEPDPTKDNKLMCILPKVSKSSVKVYDSQGNHIDTMRRFTPDHSGNPKGPRYYSAKFAYEVAKKACDNTGSNLIRIEDSPLTDGRKRSGLFK